MKQLLVAGSAILFAQGALAGGIERAVVSPGILFEEGRYAEISFGSVSPDVSGTLGVSSGDVLPSYPIVTGGYKWNYGGNWDAAVIFGQFYGANIDYPAATGYPLGGSNAKLTSTGVAALASYQLDGGISLYGGLNAQSLEMDVQLSSGYAASGDNTWGYGYVFGAAYERPEIALRAALTFRSAIDFDIDTTENVAPTSVTQVTLPQSISLDAQTGIAADTLLFGSVNYVDWSAFDITPIGFLGASGTSLVDYTDATATLNLGVGRRFSDTWSGAISVAHEPSGGGLVGNLGPTDGFTSVSLGGTYTRDNIEITGGVRYIMIGDATTTINADFADNDGLAFGLKLGFQL